MVNSHILVSQLLMRGFANKDNPKEVYYLDLEDKLIKKKEISQLDSQFGYYDNFSEKELAKIEARFGQIASEYKNFNRIKKYMEIRPKEFDYIRCFFDLLLLRNKKIIHKTIGNGTSQKLLLYDYLSNYNEKSLFYTDYYPILVSNLTNRDFVLPRCCIFIVHHNAKVQYCCPINSKLMIAMIEKDEFDNLVKNNSVKYGKITDESLIEEINTIAYYTEIETSNKMIIGNKDELNNLLNIV